MPQDTELHKCAKDGDAGTSLDLIQDGVDVNAKGAQGRTALHRALGGGFVECTKVLLDNGANVESVDAMKRTSLHWAVMASGSPEDVMACVQMLFERGAASQVNALSKSNATPLHYSIMSQKLEIARLLLENGADPALEDEDGKSAMVLAKECGMKELFAARRGSTETSRKGGGLFSRMRRLSSAKAEVNL